ncbi:hypothetical protein HMPREF1552_01353, partial [Leptotrichia sp. oral taxon 879 str. F0557]
RFCFQKMLRRAGFAKGIANVPLCLKKRKNINIIKKVFINSNLSFYKSYKQLLIYFIILNNNFFTINLF